jgi:hypothetical protein
MQNFVELLATPLKEIFVVLNFVPSPRGDHAYINNFAVHIFAVPNLSVKTQNLHHVKISRYTVIYVHVG